MVYISVGTAALVSGALRGDRDTPAPIASDPAQPRAVLEVAGDGPEQGHVFQDVASAPE